MSNVLMFPKKSYNQLRLWDNETQIHYNGLEFNNLCWLRRLARYYKIPKFFTPFPNTEGQPPDFDLHIPIYWGGCQIATEGALDAKSLSDTKPFSKELLAISWTKPLIIGAGRLEEYFLIVDGKALPWPKDGYLERGSHAVASLLNLDLRMVDLTRRQALDDFFPARNEYYAFLNKLAA